MDSKSLKIKRLLLILLFLSVVMVFGTGCSVFSRNNKSRGVINESRPYGRLQPGEIDNMSGKHNQMPEKKPDESRDNDKRSAEKYEKSGKMNKKSDKKNKSQQGHWQTKKSVRKYRR